MRGGENADWKREEPSDNRDNEEEEEEEDDDEGEDDEGRGEAERVLCVTAVEVENGERMWRFFFFFLSFLVSFGNLSFSENVLCLSQRKISKSVTADTFPKMERYDSAQGCDSQDDVGIHLPFAEAPQCSPFLP
jgi:hypothetical protein